MIHTAVYVAGLPRDDCPRDDPPVFPFRAFEWREVRPLFRKATREAVEMSKKLVSAFLALSLLSTTGLAGGGGGYQRDHLIESHQLFEMAREWAATDLAHSRRLLDDAREALRRHRPRSGVDRGIAAVHSAKMRAFEIELDRREEHLRKLTAQVSRRISKRELTSAESLLAGLPDFTPSNDSR